MTSSTSTSAATTTAVTAKVCFNSNCSKPLEQPRRGWRCRTGDFAELCDRCCAAYDESKFCENFHLNASGWRCCETCGKQIHCGCIGSFHLFVLLDAGGIECMTCTRKSFILTPNPAWPPPSLFLPLQPERNKDLLSKDWSPIAGSGPVPWRQAPSLFNGFSTKYELHAKKPFERGVSGGADKLCLIERQSASSRERKTKEVSHEIMTNGCLNPGVSEVFENGDDGFKCVAQTNAVPGSPQQTHIPKNDSSTPTINSTTVYSSKTELNNNANFSTPIARPSVPSPLVGKHSCNHNGVDTSSETQSRNGKARVDGRSRNQFLPRYWPRITDQELQQISGDTNSVITPLFEKILSASDAGRIGRLVLPKKCAEAYLPPISHPEGLPLRMKDVKGNEWDFQFRFWPNNNSRMYVLEGVTPCIQSMQLQAGDIVTFSRIEPEGKLVMGGRKVSTTPSSDQVNEAVTNADGVSGNGDANTKITKRDGIDPPYTWLETGKSGHVATKLTDANHSIRAKRKYNTLASKSKRMRIENEDMIELKLTWKEAQGLIRPPPNYVPQVIAIESCEIEEYEGEPIIGRPTIPANDDKGEMIQWVQCEDCLKWRKLPANILLPSRWTCAANSWDQDRSVCLAAQECTREQLEALLPTVSKAFKKKRSVKRDPDSVETLEGLDTLANLAIREEGTSSQATTTKHPRHKPGCGCIVCMQPPSGHGKHKQPCDCMPCQSVKRRFKRMLAKKREKQQLLEMEKEAETAFNNLQPEPEPEPEPDTDLSSEVVGTTCPNQDIRQEGFLDDNTNEMEISASPLKARIDLNIQPDREEETSPCTGSMGILHFHHDATERHLKQQKQSCSGGGRV